MKKILFILLFFILVNNSSADDKMKLGLEIFNNKAQCGTCHILQSAGSEGEIGPNLDQLKPKISQVIYVVTNGIGVMPAYQDILSKEEIEAVSVYVSESTLK